MGVIILLPLIIDGISLVAILRHHRKNSEVKSTLSNLFVQQAVLYFSVVLVSSVLSGAFQLSGLVQLDGRAIVALLTLPNVMACRLILQLRGSAATPTPTEVRQQLSFVVRCGLYPEEPREPLPP